MAKLFTFITSWSYDIKEEGSCSGILCQWTTWIFFCLTLNFLCQKWLVWKCCCFHFKLHWSYFLPNVFLWGWWCEIHSSKNAGESINSSYIIINNVFLYILKGSYFHRQLQLVQSNSTVKKTRNETHNRHPILRALVQIDTTITDQNLCVL